MAAHSALEPLGAAALIVLLFPLLGRYPSEVLNNVGLYIMMAWAEHRGRLRRPAHLGTSPFSPWGYTWHPDLAEIAWMGFHLTFWKPYLCRDRGHAAASSSVCRCWHARRLPGHCHTGFGEIVRIVVGSDWLKPFIAAPMVSPAFQGQHRPLLLATPNPCTISSSRLPGCALRQHTPQGLALDGPGWRARG